LVGSSSAGEFRLLRTPTGTDAYANIILEDGNNKALEIFRGSPLAEDDLGTSNFFVQGNGAIDTKYGLTIHNGQTTKPIQLLTGDTGEERFSVK